jgi:hypothetical protein
MIRRDLGRCSCGLNLSFPIQQSGDSVMDAKTARIRALNDELRQDFAVGLAVMTPRIAALGPEAVARIVKTIAVFDDFCHANDPHEEHDFGGFDADGHRVFFKIDYKETALSAGTALGGQVFGRQWFIASMFHSLWVGKAGGELLRQHPHLSLSGAIRSVGHQAGDHDHAGRRVLTG